MIDAAMEALEYTCKQTRADLQRDRTLQHVLVRNLEILGEAASRVGPELRASHPEIAWRDMVDIRNRLIHAYFDINLDIIWTTVQRVLPEVVSQLQTILESKTGD